jgi:hypothetical protein
MIIITLLKERFYFFQMTAKLTKNPASFTAWSIERNKERKDCHRRLQSVPMFEAQYKIGRRQVSCASSEQRVKKRSDGHHGKRACGAL